MQLNMYLMILLYAFLLRKSLKTYLIFNQNDRMIPNDVIMGDIVSIIISTLVMVNILIIIYIFQIL
jgi:hypothetical protein